MGNRIQPIGSTAATARITSFVKSPRVEREHRVIAALQSTNVPVAPSFHLCEDSAVIGTPFYVMGFVQGRVFWDPTLPELQRDERAAVYENVNRVIAGLHSVDPASVGLTDYGKPGDFLARQIARWSRQYRASETAPQPAMNQLIEWLPSRVPRASAATIVHGDLRMDNMIIHPTEPRVVALLDWELSTLGDPLVDLSYHMLTWHLRADEFRGMAGVDLAGLGIPEADAYLARYVERSGRPRRRPKCGRSISSTTCSGWLPSCKESPSEWRKAPPPMPPPRRLAPKRVRLASWPGAVRRNISARAEPYSQRNPKCLTTPVPRCRRCSSA